MGYIRVKKLSDLKGHSECYVTNQRFHPDSYNTVLLKVTPKDRRDLHERLVRQLRVWLKEKNLFMKDS